MMPELSIIVPVYNVEQYLRKCLDSIQSQSFKDFEVILIDDGSTDGSGAICDEYAARDDRFKVLHQENSGVSAARNAGLEKAKGKYLGFVDADDWIDSDMYRDMIAVADEGNYAVVICGINYWLDGKKKTVKTIKNDKEWNRENLIKDLYESPSEVTGACCNKIFLRNSISEIAFDEKLHMAEDIVYLSRCFELVNSGYQLQRSYYNVEERADSATRKDKIPAMYRIVVEGKKTMMNMAMKHSKEVRQAAIIKYLDDCIRYSNLIKRAGKTNRDPYLKEFMLLRIEVLRRLPQLLLSGEIPAKVIRRFLLESLT